MTTVREPLLVRENDRIIFGVCGAVASHLGFSPWYARVVAVFVPFLIPIYAFLAVVIPEEGRPEAAQARLARVQKSIESSRLRRLEIPLLLVALAVGILLMGVNLGGGFFGALTAFLLAAFGLAVVWSKPASPKTSVALVRIAIGGTAVAGALTVALMLFIGGPVNSANLTAVVFVLPVLAVMVGPAIYRILTELTDERLQREREAERADIAAHLHDSVLQTLGVIRARADDPTEVARLARSQERELRRWLYEDRPEPGESLSDEIEVAAGRVEDTHGGVVEVVVAGDARPGEWSSPLVAALGEACTNALNHGGGEASVYVEIGAYQVDAWVRDRGAGFDLDAVAPDRVGVRESILHRMERAGGGAEVHSPLPDGGTEVHLWTNIK
ncbi:MAG: PspC domain-containing protein [Ruaniaceae bacterium]|nr:PspC domain-containing protein [Ruaniaceae bacterium]